VLLSVREGDSKAFERNVAQLKPFLAGVGCVEGRGAGEGTASPLVASTPHLGGRCAAWRRSAQPPLAPSTTSPIYITHPPPPPAATTGRRPRRGGTSWACCSCTSSQRPGWLSSTTRWSSCGRGTEPRPRSPFRSSSRRTSWAAATTRRVRQCAGLGGVPPRAPPAPAPHARACPLARAQFVAHAGTLRAGWRGHHSTPPSPRATHARPRRSWPRAGRCPRSTTRPSWRASRARCASRSPTAPQQRTSRCPSPRRRR
jgi:hypothetical protein